VAQNQVAENLVVQDQERRIRSAGSGSLESSSAAGLDNGESGSAGPGRGRLAQGHVTEDHIAKDFAADDQIAQSLVMQDSTES
jgi:hypothetical protein